MRVRDLRSGSVVDQVWVVDEVLGGGGMGSVFACTHREHGGRAALKLLHEHVAADGRLRARFVTEGRALARVPHPGVVRALGEGTFLGVPYLVMELADGMSLKALAAARGGALPLSELGPIVSQLLDALAAAHDANVIHRDLKPDNIVVAPDGRARLVDFGIARIEDAEGNTTTGTTLGTPAFMAPEQVLGREGNVDRRADLFSLGAVIRKVLTGENLHAPATGGELLIAMGTQQAPSIFTLLPTLPRPVGLVIDRALRFDRAERFQNAREMSAAWRAALAAPAGASRTIPMQQQVPRTSPTVGDQQGSKLGVQAASAVTMAGPAPTLSPVAPLDARAAPPSSNKALAVVLAVLAGILVVGIAGFALFMSLVQRSLVAKEIPVEELDVAETKEKLSASPQGIRATMVTVTKFGVTVVGASPDGRAVSVNCPNVSAPCQVTDHGASTPTGGQDFDLAEVPWGDLREAIRTTVLDASGTLPKHATVEFAAFSHIIGARGWTVSLRAGNENALRCWSIETRRLGCEPVIDLPPNIVDPPAKIPEPSVTVRPVPRPTPPKAPRAVELDF